MLLPKIKHHHHSYWISILWQESRNQANGFLIFVNLTYISASRIDQDLRHAPSPSTPPALLLLPPDPISALGTASSQTTSELVAAWFDSIKVGSFGLLRRPETDLQHFLKSSLVGLKMHTKCLMKCLK
ncbi:hypothetical protein LXL04_012194 [Taraxacum kok-saghyz]